MSLGISRFHVLVATAGLAVLSMGLSAPAGTISVTSQVRTDTAVAGTVTQTNSAPDNGAFDDMTTATSTSGLVTTTASQNSSFGVSGSKFVADVTLSATENVQDNEYNNGKPSFELDFTVSANSAYNFDGSTTLSFNGSNDLSTGASYTGMTLKLAQGGTSFFSVNQNTLTSDPQTFAYSGTLTPGDYVLTMSLDGGGAGGDIEGSLSGDLSIANGPGVSSAVPLPAAIETAPIFLGALALLKLGSVAMRSRRLAS